MHAGTRRPPRRRATRTTRMPRPDAERHAPPTHHAPTRHLLAGGLWRLQGSSLADDDLHVDFEER